MSASTEPEPEWFTSFRETISTKLVAIEQKLDNLYEIKNMVESNRAMAESNKALVLELKEKNSALTKEVAILKHKAINIEAQSRRNNLIFEGIPEHQNGNESWDV